jgi:hypothetical protein
MVASAWTLFVAYTAVSFGLRTWLQVLAAGDTGFCAQPRQEQNGRDEQDQHPRCQGGPVAHQWPFQPSLMA